MKNTRMVLIVAGMVVIGLSIHEECRAQAPAAGGGIKVTVKFTGTAPVMPKLNRSSDPFCGKTPMNDQEVLVNPNGTLKNVAVRISQGAPAASAAPAATTPPADAIVMDQNNCMYTPRVAAGVVGQKLVFRNSDPLLHNIHSYAGTVTGYNLAQIKGSKDIEKTIAAGVTRLKCDVHPWMTGYVVGNENAFVCVTGDNGECTLAGVPAGSYTIEAWQEKYGTKTAQVTVAAGQPTVAEVTYSAP